MVSQLSQNHHNNIIHVKSVSMRLATKDDEHLAHYDNTRLSNMNTCPTWGAIRYGLHLRMPGAGRALALEAGACAHDGFAMLRLFHLAKQLDDFAHPIVINSGTKQLGDRFLDAWDTLNANNTDRTNMVNLTSTIVNNSDYYDDPSDRYRTVANIETSLIARGDRWNFDENIWIRDNTDPKSDVGIEIGFDIVVTIEYIYASDPDNIHTLVRRFVGKLDGLHINRKGNLVVCEDKTGARLDDAWLAQWILSHQITGYCLAGSTFVGEPIHKARVTGMKIPIAKDIVSTVREETVNRNEMLYTKWAEWFVHSVITFEAATADPLRAPMYTHSCNRYFNSCSFVPYCAAYDDDEKRQILEDMEFDEWHPLHE